MKKVLTLFGLLFVLLGSAHAQKGKQATFQYIEDGHHCEQHLHLQCTKCGRIFHLECDFMGEIATHIQREHGFYIECKKSIIYGICKDCVKK